MKKRFLPFFVILVSLLLVVSCKQDSEENTQKPVARVYDNYLYMDEIKSVMPDELSKEDSLTFVKNYVSQWIMKELMRKTSNEKLSESEKNVDKLIDDYRTSLLIYRMEQKIIKDKMNSEVSHQEVDEYYKKNSDEFILTKNALIPLYVKVPLNAPDIQKVRSLCKLENVTDLEELDEYCTDHATEFFFKEEWVYLSDLMKKIPIVTDNEEQFIKYSKFHEIKDSSYYYFLNIKDHRLKGEVSPLSFVYDKIVAIVLTTRKMEIIDKYEKSIYNENIENIEIFEN